jgi:hypothetical protein
MAEWSIATVLKTVDCNRSGGSNPSLSAEHVVKTFETPFKRFKRGFCFLGYTKYSKIPNKNWIKS